MSQSPQQPPQEPSQSEPYDWQPPPQPAPPEPEKKRFSFLALGLTALVALVVGSLLGAVGYSWSRRTATVAAEPAPTVTVTETAPVEGEPPFEEPTEEPTSESTRAVKKSDFELTVKILDKSATAAGRVAASTIECSPSTSARPQSRWV